MNSGAIENHHGLAVQGHLQQQTSDKQTDHDGHDICHAQIR
jgi:hypothetical protein